MNKILIIISLFCLLLIQPGTSQSNSKILNCGDSINETTVLNNNLLDCPEHGLLIQSSNLVLDCNNYVIDGDDSGADFGILSVLQTNVTIKNCIVQEFDAGIYDYYGYGNSIKNNIVNKNGLYGIYVGFTENDTIINNIASNNDIFGIDLWNCSNNILSNNTFNKNKDGLRLGYHSNSNLIQQNKIKYNSNFGVKLEYTSIDNNIYGNHLIKNTISNSYEDSDSLYNSWNNSLQGNYWSDFFYNSGYPDYYEIYGGGGGIDYFPISPYKNPIERIPKVT